MTHVRMARSEDADAVIELGRWQHGESVHRDLPYDAARLKSLWDRVLSGKSGGCVLVAEGADGAPCGYLYGSVAPHFFSPAVAATVQAWYVVPERRGTLAGVKLLHAFRRWSRANGVARLYVNIAGGVDMQRSDRLLRKLGFQCAGGNYVLV